MSKETMPDQLGDPAPRKRGGGVSLVDSQGQPLGIELQIGAPEKFEDDPTGRKATASRIKGWETFEVAGQPYEYSPEAALNFLNRFPEFEQQIR